MDLIDLSDPAWSVTAQFIPISGTPEIRLFTATRNDSLYLTDADAAMVQLRYANPGYPEYVLPFSVDEWETELPIHQYFNGLNQPAPENRAGFIFEGVGAGVGILTFRLYYNDVIIGATQTQIELRDIKSFYEHWTVGDTTDMNVSNIPLLASLTGDSAPLDERDLFGDDYVLFVHGWRMKPWERRYFAETAYKRMFWQGYDGRFGLFSWPTEWVDPAVAQPQNYDRSERKAYVSGFGLRMLLQQLYDDYSGSVNIFGHSMGNIVISEALRLEATSPTPERIVNVYVASQASSVAHAYDATVPATEDGSSTQTPEVYAGYPPTGRPYYEDIDLAANRLVNFYNPHDFALSATSWGTNQDAKPDVGWGYDEETNTWFRGTLSETPLSFPDDRYEIFAHIAEARSRALGSQANVGGPFSIIDQVDLDAAYGFGGSSQTSHSSQFLLSNMERGLYWRQVLVTFGLLS